MQHHPVRPHSQQDARDPRYAPIPPPPYSTRPSSARPDILHSSDPFLRRRVDVAEQPMHSQPYAYTTAPNYTTPSLGIHGLGEIRRDDHGQVARDRHEHIGQYGSQLPEGTLYLTHLLSPLLLVCFLHHPCVKSASTEGGCYVRETGKASTQGCSLEAIGIPSLMISVPE